MIRLNYYAVNVIDAGVHAADMQSMSCNVSMTIRLNNETRLLESTLSTMIRLNYYAANVIHAMHIFHPPHI